MPINLILGGNYFPNKPNWQNKLIYVFCERHGCPVNGRKLRPRNACKCEQLHKLSESREDSRTEEVGAGSLIYSDKGNSGIRGVYIGQQARTLFNAAMTFKGAPGSCRDSSCIKRKIHSLSTRWHYRCILCITMRDPHPSPPQHNTRRVLPYSMRRMQTALPAKRRRCCWSFLTSV